MTPLNKIPEAATRNPPPYCSDFDMYEWPLELD